MLEADEMRHVALDRGLFAVPPRPFARVHALPPMGAEPPVVITSVSQRWRDRRGAYRPAGEVIVTRDYEVASIADDTTAKAFVLQHHYSGSFPAARLRFGLYRRSELVGVVVLSHPVNALVLAPLPGVGLERAELGRLVLLDDVPGNGETWFLARCFELASREGLVSLVSFSDPVARTSASGAVVFPGHVGTIYQASNAVYRGRSKAAKLHMFHDGHVIHNRALAKIRKRERGWRAAAALLEAYGAEPLGKRRNARAWLQLWTSRLTRPLEHGGNHRYYFGLTRAARRHLPPSLLYPKMGLGQCDLAFVT